MPGIGKKFKKLRRDQQGRKDSKPSNLAGFQTKKHLTGSLIKHLRSKKIKIGSSILPREKHEKWKPPEPLETAPERKSITRKDLVQEMMKTHPSPRFYGYDNPRKKHVKNKK